MLYGPMSKEEMRINNRNIREKKHEQKGLRHYVQLFLNKNGK